MELAFITDAQLRQRIEDSIEYIYALYEESKHSDKNELYQTETYRVIILYTVSIIEAVLFYIYEKRGSVLTKTEYKEREYLHESYKNSKVSGKLVVAVEKITEKSESEIGLKELVNFLSIEKIIKRETEEKLLNVIKTRNSVHLRQKGTNSCTIDEVEDALELLVYILSHAPRSIKIE